MKKPLFLVAAILFISACAHSTNSGQKDDTQNRQANAFAETGTEAGRLISLTDAEKILGAPAHLSDSSVERKPGVVTCHLAYKANAKDVSGQKTGAVYFVFEEYSQLPSAEKKYSSIKTANANHEGIKVLDDLGDEAYYHSDGENFHFIMVRKGAKVFVMKVNKITSTTSLDEFYLVSKQITKKL